jgi:hypothetical protein
LLDRTRSEEEFAIKENQGDVFVKGLESIAGQRDLIHRHADTEVEPPKKVVLNNTKSLDVSSLFPEDTGTDVGVTLFTINKFHPTRLPAKDYGTFCESECYIVLEVCWGDTRVKSLWLLLQSR